MPEQKKAGAGHPRGLQRVWEETGRIIALLFRQDADAVAQNWGEIASSVEEALTGMRDGLTGSSGDDFLWEIAARAPHLSSRVRFLEAERLRLGVLIQECCGWARGDESARQLLLAELVRLRSALGVYLARENDVLLTALLQDEGTGD